MEEIDSILSTGVLDPAQGQAHVRSQPAVGESGKSVLEANLRKAVLSFSSEGWVLAR